MVRVKGLRILCLGACLWSTSGLAATSPSLHDQVGAWTQGHQKQILSEFTDFLALPDVATDVPDMQANAKLLVKMIEVRGLKARILSAGPGTPPDVYAEWKVPGARRTVMYYAHYDGQPVTPSQWRSPPFTPVMRDGPDGKDVDWRAAKALDPEWRLYARSAGDDKDSEEAILSALDALKAAGRSPSVNVKLFFDGEEEQGSPHIEAILRANQELLKSDLWIIGDGPVHPSRRPQLYFGARGDTALEMTVYGPIKAMHSGHYGNWVPNPAVEAAEIVAALRDSEGRILVPGYSDQVRPLTPEEKAALAALPDAETGLKKELEIGRSEGTQRLADSLMRPAINVRGLSSGHVGAEAANAIPVDAKISLDLRLVPDQTPDEVRAKLETYLSSKGYTLIDHEPSAAERMAAPRLVRMQWDSGYPSWRTDMSLPVSKAVIAAAGHAAGQPVIVNPMLGGSVPMYLFATIFDAPVIGVPIANHDDNQHAKDENLRLQNLWDGIQTYAGLMGDLNW
ncbi:MAG TPA: M20/M25/M40 family metallo-hydrolase [Gammaproteobacteria bacterium]|nr:M20/M25/M40 family metallo-hydrolase [Gammaproteobacteria bacterium]